MIFGSVGSETITTSSNDDIIDPMGGSDVINAGLGTDKVLFFQPSSNFTWITDGLKTTLTGNENANEYAGHTITIKNAENIIFTDKVLDVTYEIPADIILSNTRFEINEGGSSATLEVSLSRKPIDDVTISFNTNSSDITLSSSSLIFNSNNWSNKQTLTISATDDSEVENLEVANITVSSSSRDDLFAEVNSKNIEVLYEDFMWIHKI